MGGKAEFGNSVSKAATILIVLGGIRMLRSQTEKPCLYNFFSCFYSKAFVFKQLKKGSLSQKGSLWGSCYNFG
jgi:hypothetical protein